MKRENKNKKYYNSPSMDEIIVDQEISMVMMTQPPGDYTPPGTNPFLKTGSTSSLDNNPLNTSTPSTENNPFGGNSVSY
ncbi:hypothetical protein [Saccharicrinis aurantiacus]|uniref:hypothetical protein n=1 Tax=Saccharicrinis aurantiacus TaxID=1849719 RepID=UPI0024928C16|nr:hypothetical protein [Saccharicrinis aurantiacus]